MSYSRMLLSAFVLAALTSATEAQTANDGAHHSRHQEAGQTPSPQQGDHAAGSMDSCGMATMGDNTGMTMPMRHGMHGHAGHMGGAAMPFDHIEGRIAFLKAELGITEAQQAQWNTFADALRSTAATHKSIHGQMMSGPTPTGWSDRLAALRTLMSARLDAVTSLHDAAQPLYAVLSDDQKALADRLLSGPMGMM